MGDGRSAERMKRGDELNGVGRNGFSDCALAREAGQGRNGEDVELQSEEFLRALVVLIRRNGSVVAVVHPHACGGGLGDVSVMEVVRELEAVAPATDDERESENGEDAGLEELEDCEL